MQYKVILAKNKVSLNSHLENFARLALIAGENYGNKIFSVTGCKN